MYRMQLKDELDSIVISEHKETLDSMTNWSKLNAYLSLTKPNLDTLLQMMALEIKTNNRLGIIDRLVGRYATIWREECKAFILNESIEATRAKNVRKGR